MEALRQDLLVLLERFESELAYNDAKGDSTYRQGMHDGLHFGRDALADVLERHGLVPHGAADREPPGAVVPPRQYGL